MIVCQSYVLPRHHNTLIVILESYHFSKEKGSEAIDLVTINVPPRCHTLDMRVFVCRLLLFLLQLSSFYSPFVGGSGGNTKALS